MKKLLLVCGLLIDVFGIFLFFTYLSASFIIALVLLVVSLISSVPFFAIIYLIEENEALKEKIETVNSKLFKESQKDYSDGNATLVPPPDKTEAKHSWDCSRCGTVNKAGTTECANCGAMYYAWTDTSI